MRPRRDGPGPARLDPTSQQQAQYLRRLGRIIVHAHGADAGCELRWQESRPYLPYLQLRGVSVWAVSTSTGWRFLWNRYRSHAVIDPSRAAEEISADLSGSCEPPRLG